MKENHSKSRAEEYILKNKDKIRFFVNCGGQKLSLSIMKCVTE